MAITFLTPARTVLLIGDEALYVYKVTHNSAKMLDVVSWQSEDFEDIVVNLIRKDGGGKPVLIVNDMTDQHFKGGQRMPKVGFADKGSVLKRKLQVAFPNYPIRGALPIKGADKRGAGVKGAGALFLFAAVPVSEPVMRTLEAVKISLASIAGFVLLPVESSDMVSALSQKLSGKSKEASRWTVFIGQHQNGALRQVITRDGQLAMTRMTPVADPDDNPQGWAHDVGQEFKATVSYLSRFGYSTEDGTDVIVISAPEAGNQLEKLIEIPCKFHSFTVNEAARLLGMNIGLQDDPRFAEPLHVAWAGRKNSFVLPMEAEDITRIHQPRKVVALALMLLVLSGMYLAYDLIGRTQVMVSKKDDLQAQRVVLAQAEKEFQEEKSKLEALGYDVDLIQGAIKAYDSFELDRLRLLALLKDIGQSLGNELRLDSFSVDKVSPGKITEEYGVEKIKKATLEASLELSFPPDQIELEQGIREVNELHRRLKEALPDYDVQIKRQIARPEYTQNIKGEATKLKTAQELAAEEDYVAELTIKGPMG